MSASFKPQTVFFALFPLAACGCDPSAGRQAAEPPPKPPLAAEVREAVDYAYREAREATVQATERFTVSNLAYVRRGGQGITSPKLHLMVAETIKEIRRAECRLFLLELKGELPTEAARSSLLDWRLNDAGLATHLEEMIVRRFQQTAGGYRYRVFESVHTEMQAFCDDRKAAWLELLTLHQDAPPAPLAAETEDAEPFGEYVEAVRRWLES